MKLEKILISIPPVETNFDSDIYEEFVSILVEDIDNAPNSKELLSLYSYPIENIRQIAESDNIEYKETIRNMANDLWEQNDWLNVVFVYYILMHIVAFLPNDFYKLGYSLGKLHHPDLAQKIIMIYENLSINKKVACHAIANFYYTSVDSPLKARAYFEKYLEFDPNNANTYLTLGHIYSRIDDEVSKEKQMEALHKAYELNPENPTIVKSLLTAYEKRHDDEKVKMLYPKLLNLAPSPRHSMNYGLYLMSWGDFQNGGKYFAERFDIDEYPIGYPKGVLNLSNRWDYKEDLSDKLLLVHFEEGFGDTIMYSRFLPIIKQFTKKTAFIVQPELFKLLKQSPIISEGVELFTGIKEFIAKYKNEKFVHMPLLDLPYALGIDKQFLPYTSKYIVAESPKKFKSNKLNIGIAYSGDISANYHGRDVGVDKFVDLARLDKIQLYSLQVGDSSKQLKDLPKDVSIIDLGNKNKSFTDTANSIAGLDLIISTDNVILNLAGAMGKPTLGIFNKYPNFRWFNLGGENVVWYESVKPFQCEFENDWESVFVKIKEAVSSIGNKNE